MDTSPGNDAEPVEVVNGVFDTQIAEGERPNLRQCESAPGARVPRHDRSHDQGEYGVRGRSTFVTDGRGQVLKPGDSCVIPGDEPHALENRTDERVVELDGVSPRQSFAPFAEDT